MAYGLPGIEHGHTVGTKYKLWEYRQYWIDRGFTVLGTQIWAATNESVDGAQNWQRERLGLVDASFSG
jgi:hypothetical protein